MITLREEITVARSVHDCFRYVADFRTVAEWDATAVRAEKVSPGPVAVGSKFDVDCEVGPSTLRLHYEITEFEPWASLVLIGRGRFFDVEDTITFTETDAGTHILYCAAFTYRWGLGRMEARLESGMRAMGSESLAGMKRALEAIPPEPKISTCSERADRWVAPGVALFSKWGYRRSVAQRQPVSNFMDGQHVLLTGASSGLGLASAIALADAGADLTLVIRNPEKRDELLSTIALETGRDDIAIELADLGLMSDVEDLSARLLKNGKPIDVLINNAGALFNEYALTPEGLERSFALLLLSPWRLTRNLHPLLAGHDQPARVINVVSGGMYTEKLSCERLIMTPDDYQGPRAYARAKRALTVLTELWAQEWANDGIVVNAMHPGWADTPGVASALPTFRAVTRTILRSPEEGADTIIWLARALEASKATGQLFLDREPRTPYLLEKTREPTSERTQLEAFLTGQLPSRPEDGTAAG